MSFTENRLSTTPVIADWLAPDSRDRVNFLVDHELGPIAINDTSGGLFYQPWTLQYNLANGNFDLTPETVGAAVIAYNHPSVTQCTLAFDQNGRPTFAFTAAGLPKLYWYDTLAASFVTTTLGAGVTFPTVCLDDKRQTQTNSNDIILFYTKPGALGYDLFFRLQRERYTTERLLKTNVYGFVYKCGMNLGNRIQIALLEEPIIG